MKNSILVFALFPVLLLSQSPASLTFSVLGKIRLETPYKDQSKFVTWYFDSLFYEKTRLTKDFECLLLNYRSDTATVEAWLYKPVNVKGVRLPIILYCRGGMGNFGKLEPYELVNFQKMAEAGYIVLASQYRFLNANGKYDEHGGIDVNDVVNLSIVYQNLPYVDTANVFLYGYSRGGQMCYQASKRIKINAIATAAGTADWFLRINERREFVEGWQDADSLETDYLGFRKVFKNWETDSLQILEARSAVRWADQIGAPVLLMHSRLDDRVVCDNSLRLAERLQFFKKPYSLIVYDAPSHSLPFKYFDSYERMFEWFEKYKRK
ncbi:MAG: prolyl oligopeptidase family serine peptidase [Saprospiraceae bacterium]|nr:prolyl oligopeptidase family serine peptidase [Saprospiraceae bacterium]